MKTQLKIIIVLLLWLNIILTIDLFNRSTETAQAGQIQEVDIVRVGGNWIGGKLPVR